MDQHSLDCLDFSKICDLLARYALTGLGRRLAAGIKPVSRADLIRRWQRQVIELRTLVEKRGLPPFGGVSDIREMVVRCAPPLQVNLEEMARIGDTLAATHELVRYLANLPEDQAELRHLAERVGDFGTIAIRIRSVIDERGLVRDDASPKLARIRNDIQTAAAGFREVVDKLLRDPNIRKILQYPNHTFHNDRLVLPLKTEYRGRLPGIVHRSSDSGATLYVEPGEAVELNNRITNLRSEEAEEIGRLLWDLAHEVYLNVEAITKTVDALAVLDLLSAKVRFCADFDMTCPEIVDEPRVSIRGARHPLLMELRRVQTAPGSAPAPIVPITYRLGEDFNMLIITGPNTGGKTVTLKTVGLLTLMVQAGLPVPVAEGSVFGVFNRVLIDVGDEQSMQQSLSTFSAHLTRQMEMLRKAGPRTLVLIDEIGAGTDPDEGAAIGRALLDELLRLEARAITTTHLGALKSYPLMRKRVENGCVEFDEATLRPTYHLRIGEPGMSNAIAIAERLGMPARLVQAARRALDHKSRELSAALRETSSAKRDAESARAAAEDARMEAGRAHTAAREARDVYRKQQVAFEEWVARIVHLQPGDPVRVRNFTRDGRIVRLRIDQQRAEVDLGVFAVEVPLGDILPPETVAPPPRLPRPAPPIPGGTEPGRGRRRRAERQQRSIEHPAPANSERHAVVSTAVPPAVDHAQHDRPAPRPPQAHSQARRHEPPPIAFMPLSDEEILALAPQSEIVVKRLQRAGRLIRVKAEKKIALVSVGNLEVEVPFSGIGKPR